MTGLDAVATEVLTGAGGRGAVRFEGWLGPSTDAPLVTAAAADAAELAVTLAATPSTAETAAAQDARAAADAAAESEAAAGKFRLFTDPQFMEWLEIPADAILHQFEGTNDPEGRSIVWVKREAKVARCQSGCAYQFAELELAESADDPTARRPRPYP